MQQIALLCAAFLTEGITLTRMKHWILLICLLFSPVLAENPLQSAIDAYRAGQYAQAESLLKTAPDSPTATYYRALTQAQLGRYTEARRLYESVIRTAPQSPEAQLASEGLNYLPAQNELDLPPRFVQEPPAAAGFYPQPAPAMMPGGGMMPGFGVYPPWGGATGGMNPMDPNVMSTMMMNQMLQNFNFDGGGSNNR
jgi:tetratricopeptide (TPR) repeat protein